MFLSIPTEKPTESSPFILNEYDIIFLLYTMITSLKLPCFQLIIDHRRLSLFHLSKNKYSNDIIQFLMVDIEFR